MNSSFKLALIQIGAYKKKGSNSSVTLLLLNGMIMTLYTLEYVFKISMMSTAIMICAEKKLTIKFGTNGFEEPLNLSLF